MPERSVWRYFFILLVLDEMLVVGPLLLGEGEEVVVLESHRFSSHLHFDLQGFDLVSLGFYDLCLDLSFVFCCS